MNDEEFITIIDATPLVAIDLLINNQQGEVLLGRRNNRPAQGYWFVPGGRIRKNETLAAAMERISQAELGVPFQLADASLQGAYEHLYEDNFKGKVGISTHYVCLGYRVLLDNEHHLSTDEQHAEFKWWSVNDLLSSDVVHGNTKAYFVDC